MKKKNEDKAKKRDLRDNLGGRVVPGGINEAVLHEPAGPDIVSPGVKEPEGQTTHE